MLVASFGAQVLEKGDLAGDLVCLPACILRFVTSPSSTAFLLHFCNGTIQTFLAKLKSCSQLQMHLLGGCVLCLACIETHCKQATDFEVYEAEALLA